MQLSPPTSLQLDYKVASFSCIIKAELIKMTRQKKKNKKR